MNAVTTGARHRAARRPLSTLASAATASSVGRRTAVVAASSGLIVSMLGAMPANAAPVDHDTAKLNTVDLNALTTQARAALESAPSVTVAAEAGFTIESAAVAVTPAPEPEPEPVVERATQASSRSAARTANTTATTSTTEKAASVSVPASANGSAIVSIASRYVGVPYVYGGTTPDGFDCSGFTSYVFAQVGITLPRQSSAQGNVGTKVSRADAQPGDLIWTPGHISIYAGDNMQIDAPRPGKTIQFRQIWQSNPTFIRVA
ncbi:glycoside hydrolase [Oerskovia sp. Root918]|uniref:Gamma-DL-glutamyl hydrolase n=2 Tax=Cellulomonadaceae TaxID=85016 RepID=A0A163T2Z5_9CELL|nr:glycoside hydrolase [Oerskovia sp. Root22]KRD47295.1 glycoside hydrolase [Oerskovia sp. Root918]KZM37041.1 gamma-DL-glutamyl hydrolase precursor [Oerskovia enterophila]OCI30615.1 gamma-DL-glutamyl hydrolase precursor [Oerskovia enterophila]